MIPNRLKKGDTIGVIAPSSPVTPDKIEDIEKSKKLMENAGYKIEFGKYVFTNELGYGATAKHKAEDISSMFKNKNIKAIFCASGGANCNCTFDYIDYDIIKENPKIICGFSDSTSITNVIHEKTGLVTFNGSTFKALTSWDTDYAYKEVIKRFELASLELGNKDDKFISIKNGICEGELVGGNLTLTSKLVCGKYKIDFNDKILFIEELGYEADAEMVSNCLYYMKQNKVFEQIKGIWVGNYEHPSEIALEKILLDTLENEYNFPIIKSNNFGHTDKKTVIPIGTKAKIDNDKIKLIESCVN